MGLPSKRRTKQQKRERASHFALVEVSLTTCSHCKRKILPHRVCPYCGYYRGKEVVAMTTDLDKKHKRRQAKRAKGEKEKPESS